MSNLPLGFDGDADLPARRSKAVQRRSRAIAMTPEQEVIAKRNRRWIAMLSIPTLVIGVIGVGLSLYASSRGPNVTPASVPTGFKSVTDQYYAYIVPSKWSTSSVYSDYAGDLFNGYKTAWAAENLGTRINPPVPDEAQPASLKSFGENDPTPYQLSSPHTLALPGITTAYEYQMTRPGGFTAILIDAWQGQTGAEIWLLIHAPLVTTDTIIGSLKG